MSFELTTKRLKLQVCDSQYAEEILQFYTKNAQLFDTYEPTRPANFYTFAYQKAAANYEFNEIVKGKTLRYYVFLNENPSVIIGSINFSRLEHGPFSKASIGYKFDADYQRKGYAFEACQAAIPVLFQNYNIHRLEARVSPENVPSIHLLEKLEFQFEGIEYKSVEINGSFTDHYRYSLLSPCYRSSTTQ